MGEKSLKVSIIKSVHLEHKFEVLSALLLDVDTAMTEGVKGLVRVINPCGRNPSDTRGREKEVGAGGPSDTTMAEDVEITQEAIETTQLKFDRVFQSCAQL